MVKIFLIYKKICNYKTNNNKNNRNHNLINKLKIKLE